MKLLTKELLTRFEKIGSQEKSKDPIVIAKFFNPTGIGTWYATEYNPTERTFFGYVSLFGDHNDELGYFRGNRQFLFHHLLSKLGFPVNSRWDRNGNWYAARPVRVKMPTSKLTLTIRKKPNRK